MRLIFSMLKFIISSIATLLLLMSICLAGLKLPAWAGNRKNIISCLKQREKMRKICLIFKLFSQLKMEKKSKRPRWNILVSPQIIKVLCPLSPYEGLIPRHLLLS